MSRYLTLCLRGVTLAVFVAFGAASARAAEAAGAELIEMFAAVCLQKFPDDSAVQQFAADKQLTVMSDTMVHQLLGADPGRGWIQETARGRYLLTIEMPPFHACAIRKTETTTPDVLAPFSLLLGTWIATQSGASLKALPAQNMQLGGLPTEVHQWIIDRGRGKPAESLMLFVTNATDRFAVRLVRQIRVQ